MLFLKATQRFSGIQLFLHNNDAYSLPNLVLSDCSFFSLCFYLRIFPTYKVEQIVMVTSPLAKSKAVPSVPFNKSSLQPKL